MAGAIIAIEGIDGSGKGTQSRLLFEYLQASGRLAALISFPCYRETFFGREVGKYLNGEYGILEKIDPRFSALLYALDRYEKRDYISELYDRGFIIICDRYVPSNMAHHGARVPEKDRDSFFDWIAAVEYGVLSIPRESITVFLDMPISKAQSLVLEKETRIYTTKKLDMHEESLGYLDNVANCFRYLSDKLNWCHINCVPGGSLLEPDQILSAIIHSLSRDRII